MMMRAGVEPVCLCGDVSGAWRNVVDLRWGRESAGALGC